MQPVKCRQCKTTSQWSGFLLNRQTVRKRKGQRTNPQIKRPKKLILKVFRNIHVSEKKNYEKTKKG